MGRERIAREVRERDAHFVADAQHTQLAIDQLTQLLSATLAKTQSLAS